jgi:hypothetical protein
MNNRRIFVTFLPRLLGLILSLFHHSQLVRLLIRRPRKRKILSIILTIKKIIRAFGGVYEDFKVGSYVAGLSLKIAKSSDEP